MSISPCISHIRAQVWRSLLVFDIAKDTSIATSLNDSFIISFFYGCLLVFPNLHLLVAAQKERMW